MAVDRGGRPQQKVKASRLEGGGNPDNGDKRGGLDPLLAGMLSPPALVGNIASSRDGAKSGRRRFSLLAAFQAELDSFLRPESNDYNQQAAGGRVNKQAMKFEIIPVEMVPSDDRFLTPVLMSFRGKRLRKSNRASLGGRFWLELEMKPVVAPSCPWEWEAF